MFGLFKKKNKCNHDWHKTIERTEDYIDCIGGVIDVIDHEVVYAYCPICDSRKRFMKKEWEIVEKEQEIKDSYITKIQ